jgi:hypothetical protein
VDNGEAASWLTLVEASRLTGRHLDTLRVMIRKGRLEARKGNAGNWLVQLPTRMQPGSHPEHPGHQPDQHPERPDHRPDDHPDGPDAHPEHSDVALLREELLEARVAAARAEAGCELLHSLVGDLRAERDRLAAELALARKGWLERVIEAVRRR